MKKSQAIIQFMKKNAVYLVLSLCIVAVGLTLLIYFLTADTPAIPDGPVIETPGDDQPVDDPTDTPDVPVDDPTDTPDVPVDDPTDTPDVPVDDPTDTPDVPVDDPTDTPDVPVDDPTDTPDVPVDDPTDTPDVPVDDPTDTPDTPVTTVISFIMPVESATSIANYSELPVFSETLGRYSAHLAIDFFAPEGTNVLAVYDGSVESVNTTLLQGTTIVIDHGNGLKTVYNSLLDGEKVNVGQTVKKGDVIGQVSCTNRQESKSGAHLHFQVIENGDIINPDKYIELDEK